MKRKFFPISKRALRALQAASKRIRSRGTDGENAATLAFNIILWQRPRTALPNAGLISGLLLAPLSLQAATWSGLTSRAWETAANWTPDGAPGNSSDVVVDNGALVNQPLLSTTTTVNTVAVSAGQLQIDPSGNLTVVHGIALSGGTLSNFGKINGNLTLTNSGILQLGNGIAAASLAGNASSATVTVSSDSSVNVMANVTLRGGIGGNGNNASPGSNGFKGADGGAGVNGMASALNNRGAVTGGNGGIGGMGGIGYLGGVGGMGGGGGAGVSGIGVTITNTGSVTAGRGGTGGYGGGATVGGSGGAGGMGGAGVSGMDFTLTNTGAVTGGQGGNGGYGGITFGGGPAGRNGIQGLGGAGVVSTGNSTIHNSGRISGGLAADGITRANAILFSGGGNTLNLQTGSALVGAIELSANSAASIASQNSGMVLSNSILLGNQAELKLDTHAGDLTLSGPLGSGAGDVSTIGGKMLTLRTVNVATVTANGSGLTLTGDVTTTGTQNYNGAVILAPTTGADVILTVSTVTFAAVTGGGNKLGIDGDAVINGAATDLGSLSINGLTTLNGNVTTSGAQTYNGPVTQLGNSFLTGTGPGAAIGFGSTVDGAHDMTVNIGGLASFGGAVGENTPLHALNVNSGTFAAVNLNIGAGGLSVTTTSGGVAQGGAFVVTGMSSFNAGGNAIFLPNAVNDFAGMVNLTGGATRITDQNALTLGALSTGALNATSTGSLNLGHGSVAGDLVATSNGGTINGASGGLRVSGISNLQAAAGAITLTDPANHFAGPVTAAGQGVNLRDSGNLTIAALNNGTNGTVNLMAGGTLTLPMSGIDTGTADLSLVADGGSLAMPGTLSGANVLLAGSEGMLLGNHLTSSGALTLTSSHGSINQVGGVISVAKLTGSSADDTTFNGANQIDTLGDFSAANFVLTNERSLTIPGTLSASSVVLIDNAGITVTGAIIASRTRIAVGTALKIGNGGTTGSITGDVINDDNLAFDRSDDLIFAGGIHGTGTLTQQGSGTLILNGDSSRFSGSTEVTNGSLIIGGVAGNGAELGGNVTMASGTTLGGRGRIGGDLMLASGAHLAPGNSLGTLHVSGNFTAAQGSQLDYEFGPTTADFSSFGRSDRTEVGGNLTLNGAVLNVSAASGFGPGLYNVIGYGGTLSESNGGISLGSVPADSAMQIQKLSGSRQVNLINATGVTLNFWNANGLASPTRMGGGNGTWTTTAPVWTDANGSVTLPMQPQPGFAIFGGAAGTVTVDNSSGDVSATGLQFANDGYTLTGDTLTLVGSGKMPNIRVGDGSNAAANSSATISAVIAGTDGLNKTDLGTLILTGTNIYSGGTTISEGTLQGNTTSIQGDITDNAVLVFDQSTDGLFAGTISGTGTLSKAGSGTLTLNHVNPFSGDTQVQTGKLIVGDDSHAGASLGGLVTVASSASLGGIGRIGALDLSGTVTPGNSVGTLHITGDATFRSGSNFQIEARTNGQADAIVADGKVTIQGGSALVVAEDGNWAPQTDYTVLTGVQGLSGQFDSASSNLVFLDPLLRYSSNHVTLSLQRNDISFASVAQTGNQRAVATVTDTLGFGNPIYDALTTVDAPTARDAFDQLSGEIHSSTTTALIDDSRYLRDTINRHLRGFDDKKGSTASGTSVWSSFWEHGGGYSSDGNASSIDESGGGLLIGGDLALGPNARFGAVIGHGQNSAKSSSLDSSTDVRGELAGIYASVRFGAFELRGGAAYAWQNVTTNRSVSFGGFNDRLRGEQDAQTGQAYIEGGYTFVLSPCHQLEPFVNLARVRVKNEALSETGGAAALDVSGNSAAVNVAIIGVRDTFSLNRAGTIHGHASLGWQQAWGDTDPLTSMRYASGSDRFGVNGVPVAQHAFTTELGVDFTINQNITINASYLGQFANGAQDQGGRIGLNITF